LEWRLLQILEVRKEKGHRYIVHHRGPARPTQNTQAMPVLPTRQTSTNFYAFLGLKFAGFDGNAKSSVNFLQHLIVDNYIIPACKVLVN